MEDLEKETVVVVKEASQVAENKDITVVIPYVKSEAQGNELMYALRSIACNLRHAFNVVVIGDREDWFSDKITHIPHEKRENSSPQIDILEKLCKALKSDEVSEEFIFTADDTFFMQNILLSHIEVPKTTQKHIPIALSKTRLKSMLEKQQETPVDIFSEYFESLGIMPVDANWETAPYVLRVSSQEPNEDIFKKYINERFFLNIAPTAWGTFIEKFLSDYFSEPSIYEK
ncbi:MAG: hypothetical protein H6Q12_44 [Bacteroidetes bacterium]|nr:hypothetical protein [Bacteroidota bacterium]